MKDTGGPAFPAFEHHAGYEQMMAFGGMTLRDYFAAKAVQGLLASEVNAPLKVFAIRAYAMADAMLEARHAAQ
jgi:hypothetical protein